VGVGVYVRGLLKGLSSIDTENEYFIIVNKGKNADFVPTSDNFHVLYTNVTYSSYINRDLWEHFYLPLVLQQSRIDVYHGTNYVAPFFSKVPSVVTMFDMISFAAEDWYKPLSRYRVRMLIKMSAKKSRKIITGSVSSKKDIIRLLKVPEKKVEHIYVGIDNIFKPYNEQHKLDSIKIQYNIRDKFILYVGSINPRKNLIRLIEAYNRLRPELKANYQLVIAGMKGWKADEVILKVKQAGIENRIVFTGFVPEDDLPYLINAAEFLIFPSLYEGFGIPPLEAMACGTPVLASNTSCIPEIVGDAALLFDPYNVDEIASAMYKALVKDNLRKSLVDKGFERVKLFSWEETARRTLELYREVYETAK